MAKKSATATAAPPAKGPASTKSKAPAPPPAPEPAEEKEEAVSEETSSPLPQEEENKPLPGVAGRAVEYETKDSKVYEGDAAITVDMAKDLLGWEEEEEGGPQFGDKHVTEVSRVYGRKVRLSNNIANRPIYARNLASLKQELLQNRWQMNGEPIIIGRTGLVLNGQHSLLALVLAEKDRTGPAAEHWALYHAGPITMGKVVTYGIEETDRVVNTMDTCKPRSIADVLYRSEYFANKSSTDRKTATRVLDYTLRLLWLRIGASGVAGSAFFLNRTHSEVLDFLVRHNQDNRVLRCVEHVMKEKDVNKFMSLGNAAALMYMMGCCKTDRKVYEAQEPHSGEVLDWSMWDRAGEFWVRLNTVGNPSLHELRLYLNGLDSADITGRIGAICKAWNVFSSWEEGDMESRIVRTDVEVAHHFRDEDGSLVWDESPSVGGIDLGPQKWGGRGAYKRDDPAVTPSEVQAAAEREKEAALQRMKDEGSPEESIEPEEEEEEGPTDEDFDEGTEEQGEEEEPAPVTPASRTPNQPVDTSDWKAPPSKSQMQTRKGGTRGPRG